MADAGFNTSSAILTFNSTEVGELRSLTYTCGGAVVDVGACDDSAVLVVTGRDDVEIQAEVLGGTTLTRGSAGATLAIAWNDGGTSPALTNAIITSVSTQGAMDGEITSSLTFKESPSA